jgi:hypothetical protein
VPKIITPMAVSGWPAAKRLKASHSSANMASTTIAMPSGEVAAGRDDAPRAAAMTALAAVVAAPAAVAAVLALIS